MKNNIVSGEGEGDLLSPIVKGKCFWELIDKLRQNCWPKCFCIKCETKQHTFVTFAALVENRDFKIGHYGRLGRVDRCHVMQNTCDLLPSSFWDGMFSPGFSS